jgi:hypothetical protein
MPKIKNVSGGDLDAKSLGGRLVLAGAVVEISEELFEQYDWSNHWEVVKESKSKPAAVAVDNTPEG